MCVCQVIHNHPVVPPEWKQDQTLERSFATFYQMHVQKGSFKMNAEGRVRVQSSNFIDEALSIFGLTHFVISV